MISVNGLCDIEIQFDKVSVSTKLKRGKALGYSFEKFVQYEFEAYGVEDYLADFYHEGQTVNEMKENIQTSDETDIGFSFVFPFDIDEKQIFEFAKLLKREGFFTNGLDYYYWIYFDEGGMVYEVEESLHVGG